MGALVSVNVGGRRQIAISRRGRPVISAIGKSAVAGRVAVRGVNLAGDEQADRRVHGGPDKAIYAYASEDTAWWATVLGSEFGAWRVWREPDNDRRRRVRRGHRRALADRLERA